MKRTLRQLVHETSPNFTYPILEETESTERDLVGGEMMYLVLGIAAGIIILAALVLGVFGQFRREKLQCHVSAKIRILGFVNHTHPAATELFEDTVVGDGLANHRRGLDRKLACILGSGQGQVNCCQLTLLPVASSSSRLIPEVCEIAGW